MTQFNIAVLNAWDVQSDPLRFDIWNVKVKDGLAGPELTLGEHLSSFSDNAFPGMKMFCLYGATLAYTYTRGGGVYLVNWHKVNGIRMNDPFPFRYIRRSEGSILSSSSILKSIHLLPGNRMLLFSTSRVSGKALFSLYNWERDIPLWAPLESSSFRSTKPQPIWEFKSPYPITPSTLQYPLIIGNTIRMVLPTRYTLYGLAIAMDDYTLHGIQMASLIQRPFAETALPTQAFALTKAVGIRRDQLNMFFAQYSWNGQTGDKRDRSALLRVDNPLLHRLPPFDEDDEGVPGSCLFDQFSNRVIVTDFETTCFFTIFSTKFTAVGEPFSVDRTTLPWLNDSDYESPSEFSDRSSATPEGERLSEDALGRGEHLDSRRGSPKDLPSTGRHADCEDNWEGIDSPGEASGGEIDTETGTEERQAEIDPDSRTGAAPYSDDEISWKGIGSVGDRSDEDSAADAGVLMHKVR